MQNLKPKKEIRLLENGLNVFRQIRFGSGSWCLFYRHGDEHPWYIGHNGTIAPISFCPHCGKDLRERRIFNVHTDKMDKTEAEYFVKNAIKAYSKKIDEERLRDVRTTIND